MCSLYITNLNCLIHVNSCGTEVKSTLIWLGAGRRTTTDRVRGIIDTRGYGTDGGIRDTVEVVTEHIRHCLAKSISINLPSFRMTSWESQS